MTHTSVPIARPMLVTSGPLDLCASIRREYLEMPGLCLTLEQAEKMWNVDRITCLDALEILIREGFLYRAGTVYLKKARERRLP